MMPCDELFHSYTAEPAPPPPPPGSDCARLCELLAKATLFDGLAMDEIARFARGVAQALNECRLLHIGKQVVFDEISRDPLFCRKIIAGLSRRLHHLVGDLESYSLRSGRDRIVGYLLRDEQIEGEQLHSGRVSVRLPTSKRTIASRLNLTQEHFSRILHGLIETGLIEVEGSTIDIPDLARLRASLPEGASPGFSLAAVA